MAKPPPRLFTQADLAFHTPIELPTAHAHYLGTVMRLGVDDAVVLFNGEHGEFLAKIIEIDKRRAIVAPSQLLRAQESMPTEDLAFIFAPVKKVSAEYLAQKATELGASLIQPVQTARGVVKKVKLDKLHAHAIEAAEQSERLDVPAVADMQKLSTLLQNWQSDPNFQGRRLIYCDEGSQQQEEAKRWGGRENLAQPMAELIASEKAKHEKWAVLIGPEGGFTREEQQQLRQLDFVHPVSLGQRILRAETAAFAALSLFTMLGPGGGAR